MSKDIKVVIRSAEGICHSDTISAERFAELTLTDETTELKGWPGRNGKAIAYKSGSRGRILIPASELDRINHPKQ